MIRPEPNQIVAVAGKNEKNQRGFTVSWGDEVSRMFRDDFLLLREVVEYIADATLAGYVVIFTGKETQCPS